MKAINEASDSLKVAIDNDILAKVIAAGKILDEEKVSEYD